jgi:hypothetical protein
MSTRDESRRRAPGTALVRYDRPISPPEPTPEPPPSALPVPRAPTPTPAPVAHRPPELVPAPAVPDGDAPREFHMGGCRARTDGQEGVRPVYVRLAAHDRFAHGHGWVVVEEAGPGRHLYLNFDGIWRRTMCSQYPTSAAAKAAYEAAARAELRGERPPAGVDFEPDARRRVARLPPAR